MFKDLNQVVDYIEAHLTQELTLAEIAGYAGMSDFHFRKLFYFLSGMTLSNYIRGRRLSQASLDLLHGKRVTEVAVTYGYESLDGFTRAFKNWCNMLPSEVGKKGMGTTCPKLTFINTVTGVQPMEFRIEQKPSFNIAGVSTRVPMQFEGVNQEIVKLAHSITEEQRNEMHALQDMQPREVVNASYHADARYMKEEGLLTHMIGVLTTKGEVTARLEKLPIDAHTWAIFPNDGPFPATLQQTMARIYAEWLPSSPYEVLDVPTFSFTKMRQDNTAYSEIWMAVKQREGCSSS